MGQPEKLQKVEITLADCLACSGCITSAESVLVTQQSREEILRVFQEKIAQQVKKRYHIHVHYGIYIFLCKTYFSCIFVSMIIH